MTKLPNQDDTPTEPWPVTPSVISQEIEEQKRFEQEHIENTKVFLGGLESVLLTAGKHTPGERSVVELMGLKPRERSRYITMDELTILAQSIVLPGDEHVNPEYSVVGQSYRQIYKRARIVANDINAFLQEPRKPTPYHPRQFGLSVAAGGSAGLLSAAVFGYTPEQASGYIFGMMLGAGLQSFGEHRFAKHKQIDQENNKLRAAQTIARNEFVDHVETYVHAIDTFLTLIQGEQQPKQRPEFKDPHFTQEALTTLYKKFLVTEKQFEILSKTPLWLTAVPKLNEQNIYCHESDVLKKAE